MTVENFECRLAQTQLSRYLQGVPQSEEAIAALESHLSECPTCQLILASQTNPQSPATETISEEATAHQAEAPRPAAFTHAVVAMSPMRTMFDRIPGRFRTVGLSVALAGVLIAMSTLAKDPTKLLGERAFSDDAPKVVAAGVVDREKEVAPHEAISIEQRALNAKAEVEKRQAELAAKLKAEEAKEAAQPPAKPAPKVAPTKTAATPKARRTTTRKPPVKRPATAPVSKAKPRVAPKPKSGGIVIYDSKGNKIR